MWKLEDIAPDAEYVLELRQNSEGRRSIYPRRIEISHRHPDCVLETEIVPRDFLKRRNVFQISEKVKLTSGEEFTFDAHGIWFTVAEADALMDGRPVTWVTSIPPVFRPR